MTVTMTITEKIIAAHAGKERVQPGELVEVEIDLALANDINAPLSIKELAKHGIEKLADPGKVVLVADHNTPCKDIPSAQNVKLMRDFARQHNIPYFFEGGSVGIEHVLLPEMGLVLPGDLVVGADSHTCTYGALGAFSTGMGSIDIAAAWALGKTWLKVPESLKFVFESERKPFVTGKDFILFLIGQIGVDGARYCAMEFTGEAIARLSMDERFTMTNMAIEVKSIATVLENRSWFTMTNMAIEAGAKNGIMEVDEKTLDYVRNTKVTRKPRLYRSDLNASYREVFFIDVSQVEPQVALPHLPENARSIRSLPRIEIQQAVIGSCTNGRIEDLRMAASVSRGRKVHPGVRLLVFPGSSQVLLEAEKEGLLWAFLEAGAVLAPPSCGPCPGGHLGFWRKGSGAFPPPTAILWVGWVT